MRGGKRDGSGRPQGVKNVKAACAEKVLVSARIPKKLADWMESKKPYDRAQLIEIALERLSKSPIPLP